MESQKHKLIKNVTVHGINPNTMKLERLRKKLRADAGGYFVYHAGGKLRLIWSESTQMWKKDVWEAKPLNSKS